MKNSEVDSANLVIGRLYISRDANKIKASLVAANLSEQWAMLRVSRNIRWEGTLTELYQQWDPLPLGTLRKDK